MKKIVLAAIVLSGATSALAAPFAGPWVEARAGWDSVQIEVSGGGANITESQSGFLYGAALGYDFPVSPTFVLGAWGGMYGSTAEQCFDPSVTEKACIKAGFDWELMARAGFKVSESALLYGMVGYANGKASVDYTDTAFPADNFSESATAGGVRFGVGGEYAFNQHFYGKAEYRYTSYSKEELVPGVDAGFNRNQVVFAAGYRF